MDLAMMRGTKACDILDSVLAAVNQGYNMVDFDVPDGVVSSKGRMLTPDNLAPMICALFADGDDERVALVGSSSKRACRRSPC